MSVAELAKFRTGSSVLYRVDGSCIAVLALLATQVFNVLSTLL